jgi:hypothetical protein
MTVAMLWSASRNANAGVDPLWGTDPDESAIVAAPPSLADPRFHSRYFSTPSSHAATLY